jgi:hypothetical protein
MNERSEILDGASSVSISGGLILFALTYAENSDPYDAHTNFNPFRFVRN